MLIHKRMQGLQRNPSSLLHLDGWPGQPYPDRISSFSKPSCGPAMGGPARERQSWSTDRQYVDGYERDLR